MPTLVSYVSHIMTLLPGDVVLTGTPAGVCPLVDGDTVTVRIEGIGELRQPGGHAGAPESRLGSWCGVRVKFCSRRAQRRWGMG